MKKCIVIASVCLTCAVGVIHGLQPSAGPGLPERVLLAKDEPATWEPAIRKAQGDLDAIGNILMDVALDKERGDEDRRNAIALIGKIGSDKCLDFLVANVSLAIPLKCFGGGDFTRATPCTYALCFGDSGYALDSTTPHPWGWMMDWYGCGSTWAACWTSR